MIDSKINNKTTLLILSHNRRNLELLTQVLERASYHTVTPNNYSELETALTNFKDINLGLIDLAGYNRQIWQYCDRLKSKKIPFLIFTPQYNRMIERDSLVHGASSVLVKPLVIKDLLLVIDSLVDNSS